MPFSTATVTFAGTTGLRRCWPLLALGVAAARRRRGVAAAGRCAAALVVARELRHPEHARPAQDQDARDGEHQVARASEQTPVPRPPRRRDDRRLLRHRARRQHRPRGERLATRRRNRGSAGVAPARRRGRATGRGRSRGLRVAAGRRPAVSGRLRLRRRGGASTGRGGQRGSRGPSRAPAGDSRGIGLGVAVGGLRRGGAAGAPAGVPRLAGPPAGLRPGLRGAPAGASPGLAAPGSAAPAGLRLPRLGRLRRRSRPAAPCPAPHRPRRLGGRSLRPGGRCRGGRRGRGGARSGRWRASRGCGYAGCGLPGCGCPGLRRAAAAGLAARAAGWPGFGCGCACTPALGRPAARSSRRRVRARGRPIRAGASRLALARSRATERTASPSTAASQPRSAPISWTISGKAVGTVERAAALDVSRPCDRERPLGGQLGDGARQGGGVAGVDELLDAREGALDPVRLERALHGADDLLRGRRLGPLARVEELLVDLLAGTAARRSRCAMSTSGSSPARRIMLRARSTIFTGSPISSTNTSPPVGQLARADDQLDRLGDRHEVARHLLVGDRHRAARPRSGGGRSARPSPRSRARCRSAPTA